MCEEDNISGKVGSESSGGVRKVQFSGSFKELEHMKNRSEQLGLGVCCMEHAGEGRLNMQT